MKTASITSLVTVLCALGGLLGVGAGCTAGIEKGAEADEPIDGKADGFFDPTEHGTIDFGTEQIAAFDFDERFHAFDFELSGEADVSIETSDPDGMDIDTVVYLYRQGEAGWGRYIHKDDDGGEDLLSHIDAPLGEGSYRILVKGYDEYEDGPFGVTVGCAGTGCATAEFDLAGAFAEAAVNAFYMSEADYDPVFVRQTPADASAAITPEAVRELFSAEILELMESPDWSELTIEGDSDDLLDNLAEYEEDDDDFIVDSAKAWGRIGDLFDAHLTDTGTFLVGPAAADGTMEEDYGLYIRMVIGRTADGDLAGFIVGVVWT